MKKSGNLNSSIAAVVAQMGHFDTLTIADAGLPIPPEVQRIDLVVRPGLPAFIDVLSAVLEEQVVQEVIIAEEMVTVSPELYALLRNMLGSTPVRTVPHETFKQLTRNSRAVVRSGEFTPYANAILVSGVAF